MSQKNNTGRIDEILLSEGLVTEEQIKEALEQQRQHGGRLGSHLVQLGYLTEDLLLDALAVQIGCDSVALSRKEIPPEAIAAIPAAVAVARTIVPFAIDTATNTLYVACENPSDEALLDELLFVAHDKNIRLFVAVEMSLRAALDQYYNQPVIDVDKIGQLNAAGAFADKAYYDDAPMGTILLVSDHPESDQVLRLALEDQGYTIIATDSADDAIGRLGDDTFYAVFIRDTVAGDYIDLIDRARKVSPRTIVRYYESAAQLLLDTPGFRETGTLMGKNMQLFTTLLATSGHSSASHATVVGKYTEKLCQQLGLPDKDRYYVINAAYLHDISRYYYGESKSAPDCRTRVQMTTKLLDSLSFPPLLVGMLRAMYVDLEDKYTKRLPIEFLGGNILTIVDVFCEHASFDKRMSLDKFETVRANLVSLTGRLFLKEVSEAFIALIEKEILVEPAGKNDSFSQILMYCEDADYLVAMSGRLREEGFRPVTVDQKDKFVEMYKRSCPDVIVLLQEGLAAKAKELVSGLIRQGVEISQVPTYLVASSQAVPELTLMLELGLEDVIPIENSLDLLVIKLRKLRSRIMDAPDTDPQSNTAKSPTVTSGNLEDINLVDLLQAMGPSGKTARINISADVGRLTLYLDKGKVVRAEGQGQDGAEAVYEAISWQTGHWVVQPVDQKDLPQPNTEAANEALLMEGCRRLDEKLRTPAK